MADLYCIEAWQEVNYGEIKIWPVCYRVTREDAERVVQICHEQRDKFIAELTPIWDELRHVKREVASLGRGKRIPRKVALENEERARSKRRQLRNQEADINARYANDMLDPLYPTATNGHEPSEVLYKIVEFWDDPRQMGPAGLMLLRAQLHGGSTDNDDELDEDL